MTEHHSSPAVSPYTKALYTIRVSSLPISKGWLVVRYRGITLALVLLLSAVPLALVVAVTPPQTPTVSAAPASRSTLAGAVVINEVAWGGTQASAADEWIELFNTTPVTLSLLGWRLAAVDGSPDIALGGEIAPYGFYLIERTDDDTVSDIPADLTCPFGYGLNNSGESLLLLDATGALVDTANGDGGSWPNDGEGGAPSFRSMERVTPTTPDEDSAWVSNDGSVVNGLDADGAPINGTPRAHNAAFLPVFSQHPDLAVTKSGPVEAKPGDLVSYRIDLQNVGGLTATTAYLTDTLPTGLTFQSQQSGLPFTERAPSLVWQLDDLAPGQTEVVTIMATVDDGCPLGTAMYNEVVIATPDSELLTTNNRAGCTTTVVPPNTDLSVQMSGPAIITTPTSIQYRIALANAGAHTATAVALINTLPAQTILVSQTSAYPITSTPSTVTWTLPDLPPGFATAFTVALRLQSPITAVDHITNAIAITATTLDTDLGNNHTHWVTQMGEARLLISGVLYDGYQYSDADEAVQVVNVGTASEDLNGWHICKELAGELSCKALPSLSLPPGTRAWLARDALAFAASFGFAPDRELPSWLQLANEGDEVMLRAPNGRIADTLVYGEGNTEVPGWQGAPLSYYYNYLMGETGQILHRRMSERTGLPVIDTDSALDWMQTPDDVSFGRQVQYPGWDTDKLYHPTKVQQSSTVIVGVAPDNAFDVISQTLLQARRTISIEVYSLRHPEIIELLARKAEEGVRVTVLLEGNPVGVAVSSPEWQTQLYACQLLERAGGACWYMIHRPEDRIYNRYQYMHAKLIIVDDAWVALSTQNLTQGGLPADPKANGTFGSRGAVLVTDAPALVQRAAEVFRLDFDPAHHRDLLRWNTDYLDRYGAPDPALIDLTQTDWTSYTVRFSDPLVISGVFGFELFTAPDAALRRSDALLGLLSRAGQGDELYVEQLYEPHSWGYDPEADPNLRLQAYIDAARRGARVRVLLNSRSFIEGDTGSSESALRTAQYLNDLARQDNLDLRCALGDPTGDGIHNKMILLDLHSEGRYVHVGSINGSETSSKVNREAVVQIRSDEVYGYLLRVFTTDWSLSNPVFLPIMTRRYTPPPSPADYAVISEVAYTGYRATEWIELYNPTGQPIDLSVYKLGDAEAADVFEPMFQFPLGTTIGPRATLVIAVNANSVPAANLEFYESAPEVPNMLPYPAWGSTDYPLALRNEGDQVLLLDGNDRPVDIVVWGDRGYPGVVPHPGVTIEGASLERHPAHIDTDDCAIDFRERYPPTPNSIPSVIARNAR